MSTKTTLGLIVALGSLVGLFAALAGQDSSSGRFHVFVYSAVAAALLGIGLMVYSVFRERVRDDKSPTVSRRSATTIIYAALAFAALCLFRALNH